MELRYPPKFSIAYYLTAPKCAFNPQSYKKYPNQT